MKARKLLKEKSRKTLPSFAAFQLHLFVWLFYYSLVIFVQGWDFIGGEFPTIVYREAQEAGISEGIPVNCFK